MWHGSTCSHFFFFFSYSCYSPKELYTGSCWENSTPAPLVGLISFQTDKDSVFWQSAFIYPLHFRSAFLTGSQHSPYGNKIHPHVKWECLPSLVFVSNMIYLFQWQGPMVKDVARPEVREQGKDWSDSLVTQAKAAEGERGPRGLVGSAWII